MKKGEFMNIIYGGSFNPPTIAHKKIIETIIDTYNPSNLILVPTSSKYKLKSNLISMDDRINMLLLLTNDKRIKISNYEEETKEYMGTYKTLEHFSKTYSDLYFVMGADNLDYISKWLNPIKLISEYKFIILGRKGFDLQAVLTREVDEKYHKNFSLLSFDINVSSSEVRTDIESNKDMLTKSIYEYIKNKRLYEVKL